MMWVQNYYPVGEWLSPICALLPIAGMFLLLSFFKVKGSTAALIALMLTLAVALIVFGYPTQMIIPTVLSGVLAGMFPVMYIITGAIFLYNSTLKSGQFEIIKASLENLTSDRRLQALTIAYAFVAFLDATAGFVVPVAIAVPILLGLGFDSRKAAGVTLLASATPAAFGAISVPIVVLSRVTGLPVSAISVAVGRQIPFLSFIMPFWIIYWLCGYRRTMEIAGHLAACGGSYALTTWIVSNYVSPFLTGILSALVCLGVLYVMVRCKRPDRIYCFDTDEPSGAGSGSTRRGPSTGKIIWGWSPFIFLAGLIILWSIPVVEAFFNRYTLLVTFSGLTGAVRQLPPVAPTGTPFPGPLNLNILGSAGTAIVFAALLNLVLCRFSLRKSFELLCSTLVQLQNATVSILSIFALSYVLNYSGMAGTLGLTVAGTGAFYPFFAPFLAWLSTAITGSNTATCAMLGNIQVVAARRLGISALLAGGIHATAAVSGKMIAPQSLAVAATMTGIEGLEGELLRKLFFHSLLFAFLVAVLSLIQTYVLPGMIPGGF